MVLRPIVLRTNTIRTVTLGVWTIVVVVAITETAWSAIAI